MKTSYAREVFNKIVGGHGDTLRSMGGEIQRKNSTPNTYNDTTFEIHLSSDNRDDNQSLLTNTRSVGQYQETIEGEGHVVLDRITDDRIHIHVETDRGQIGYIIMWD